MPAVDRRRRQEVERRLPVDPREPGSLRPGLIARQPVGQIPLNTLTPAKIVTSKLGKPDETMPVSNVLFSWWRYGNTAYLVAHLAANRAGYQYIAAKACNWKRTSALLTGIAK